MAGAAAGALLFGAALASCTLAPEAPKRQAVRSPTAVTDEVLALVLQGTGWQPADVVLSSDDGMAALSSPSCRFYDASNNAIPGAGVMRFVLDGHGALLARSGDMEGLARLLRSCMPPHADALLWARMLAAFSCVLSPTVITPDDKLAQATMPAGRYVPPTMHRTNGDTHVGFLAQHHNRRVFLVQAALPASGPVHINMQPVR